MRINADTDPKHILIINKLNNYLYLYYYIILYLYLYLFIYNYN